MLKKILMWGTWLFVPLVAVDAQPFTVLSQFSTAQANASLYDTNGTLLVGRAASDVSYTSGDRSATATAAPSTGGVTQTATVDLVREDSLDETNTQLRFTGNLAAMFSHDTGASIESGSTQVDLRLDFNMRFQLEHHLKLVPRRLSWVKCSEAV